MTSRTALLTGATGFLGSSLAVELLRTGRERIYCIVRPNGDSTARLHAAVHTAADTMGIPVSDLGSPERLVPIAGDMTVPGVGLAVDDLARLRAEPPAECWHAAASLLYEDRNRDEILRTNVDGTRHLLEAIDHLGIASLHHISTAYVAGKRVGDVFEAPYDPAYEPNNHYEHSKRLGEDLVVEHAGNFERVCIMRPSIVVGSLETCRSTSTSGYYGFLRGLASFCRIVERRQPGYLDVHPVRLYTEPHSTLNLVPVDQLVTEAVTIADDPEASGRYFHLTNPFPVSQAQARIGVERAIDRLRIELVEDRAELGEFDARLDDALDFYRPYLRNDKNFIRSRDAGRPPESMRISDEAMIGLSVEQLAARRGSGQATSTAGAAN